MPFETIEIKAARDIVRKKDLAFQLESAGQKYDDGRLRQLLDEAVALGLTNLETYQCMFAAVCCSSCLD